MSQSFSESLTLPELRERIVAVAASEPAAFEACLARFALSAAGRRSLKALSGALGSDYARRLATGLDEADWAAIEREAPVERPASELRELYRALLWEKMGEASRPEDPFAFVAGLDESSLARLFDSRESAELALISVYWSPARMGSLLDRLPASRRVSAIQEILLLERMPAEAARAAALAFADRLERSLRQVVPPPFRGAVPESARGGAREDVRRDSEKPLPAPVPSAIAEALERIHESRLREREVVGFLSREAGSVGERYARLQSEIDREFSRLAMDCGAVVSENPGSA